MMDFFRLPSKIKNKYIYLGISFLLHVTCIGFYFFLSTCDGFSKKIIIKDSIRVDLVGLPEIKSFQKKKKQSKVIKKKKQASNKKRKIKKQITSQIKRKIKKNIAQKKEKKQKTQEFDFVHEDPIEIQEAQTQALEKLQQEKPFQYKGEEISSGSSNEFNEVESFVIYAYLTRVKDHIRVLWNLPRFLADKNLKASVYIEINRHGDIIKVKLEKSSGNAIFDKTVLDTIRVSSPIPKPTEEVYSLIRNEGLIFNFPN